MGNAFGCEKCVPGMERSVFSFSNDLVQKYTEGRQPKPMSDDELDAQDKFEDEEMFRILKCIDDSHSEAYGLNPESLQLLLQHLEEVVHEVAGFCPTDSMKSCYKRNEECPIKCQKQVKGFEQCVDDQLGDVIKTKKCNRNYEDGQ